ncbi:tetratricopeptide repeat protein [Pseudoteredinibacter isoporae]|uniref:Ancillary SecYEG translocon subunit n=1 Tax=Pseudoteredinibacter isoporae TaxID=570281 RepID=A0A7X0MX61_9GAMM|nr:putative negative regulator of RcsB-dependent stress response [Pseudoteredinibacter isoporae]NHO88662.1 tetratricopeptide repeat protein [Pseudoteredinibacter isoporae]NIB22647.1 tetratricopeptide repeat protein [Pseudoteredinibacter isoporae]
MAEHLTEEEQLEAIKRWWDNNGKSLLTAILLGIAAYSGFQFWQNKQQAQAEAGSVVYEELLQAVGAQSPTEEQQNTAKYLAKQLVDEHSGSFYGISGDLFLAKLAVKGNDLESAAKHLNSALAQGPSEALRPIVYQRLAKVQAATGDHAAALATLDKGQTQAVVGSFAETRGDIYLAQGDNDRARASYQLALDSLAAEDFARRQPLQDKLAGVPVVALAKQDGDAQ